MTKPEGTDRALVIRWGAYGDLLIALPFLEEMSRRYKFLQLETGPRGLELLDCHPAFQFQYGKISSFDVSKYMDGVKDNSLNIGLIRWGALEESGHWDRIVNLWRTLEVECIAEEWQPEFFWPRERRRLHFGGRVFVERPFILGEIPIPPDLRMGTIFFPVEVALWMPHWRLKHQDTFNVVIVVAGSTCQKVPFGLKELAKRIMDEIPEARFFLLGTKGSGWMPTPFNMEDLQFDFGKGNVCKMVGRTPYMQAMAMVKMADYVIGPVSSLLHAAGTFGTPKSMICTDCSVYQACKYHRNDFSVQGIAPCCPCHRAIYNTDYCLTEETNLGKMPLCNMDYDKERIMEGVRFAYGIRKQRWETDVICGQHYSSIPDYSNGDTSVPPPYGRHEFSILADIFKDRTDLTIVEIGTSWADGNIYWNGYSTPFFAHLAKKCGGQFYSVDIDKKGLETAERILKRYGLNHAGVHLVHQDGMEFLKNWPEHRKIDLLYLDGWVYGPDDFRKLTMLDSEIKHREAAQIAVPLVADGGFILVDDVIDVRTCSGKGHLAIPYLAEEGWECISIGKQALFRKPEPKGS